MKNPTAGKAKWAFLEIAMKARTYKEVVDRIDGMINSDYEPDDLHLAFAEMRTSQEELWEAIEKHDGYFPKPEENHEG